MEGVRIDAAGKDLAAMRNHRIVGAGKTGDAVQQDDDVLLRLDEALRLFEYHVRYLNVTLGRLIKRGTDNFGAYGALHICNFLRALIDEQNDQLHLGVIANDTIGHFLEENRLTGFGRRDDHPALSLANGGQEIHDAHGVFPRDGLKLQPTRWIERSKIIEEDAFTNEIRMVIVDCFDTQEGKESLPLLGRSHLPAHTVAGAQAEFLNLRGGNVDVVR